MQHAGVQYGPGAAPTLHSTHYTPPENTPSVPNGNTTTSVLRSWRKKDATTEKLPPTEPPPVENQGPVARVAPHAHYPKQPVSDAYRFGQAFGEYSLPQAPQAPVPVKYSEIIEPMQGGIDHISPLVMAKPKEKYLDMCHIQQPHAVNTTNYKPYSETMKNYASMQQYKEQFHPYMQKESQIPSNYVQKESNFSPYLPNYKMQNQYPRSYRENNDFLTSLNKIAPQMAQDIINDPHLRDSSQFPMYHSLEQNRLYQQQQRMYQPIHPTPSYGQRTLPPQNYNQYGMGMNQQRISTDSYRLHQYQNNLTRYPHEQMPPPPPNTISPRHQYSEMNFPPLPHRISPSYPPCSQLEYSQHYQHRQATPVRQEYIPASDKTTYLDNPPEIPEIVPEESVQHPTKSLKRFLETWSEDHIVEESETQASSSQLDKAQTIKTPTPGRTGAGENTLYVLDAMEISSENIPQYLHLQSIDKLPPNIRGFYNSTETKTTGDGDASKNCVVAAEKTREPVKPMKNEEANGEEVIESVIKSLPDLSYQNETVDANSASLTKPEKEKTNEESRENNTQCDLFKAKSQGEKEQSEKAETKDSKSDEEEEEEEEDDEDQSSVYSDYSDDGISDRNERSRSPIAPIIISCGESVIIKRKVESETKNKVNCVSEERALNLSKRHPSENEADNNNEKQFVDKHDETENEESFKVEKRGVIIERRKYDAEVNNCDACVGQNQLENDKSADEIQEDVKNEETPSESDQNNDGTSFEKEANGKEPIGNEENHVEIDLSSPLREDKATDDALEKQESSTDEESMEDNADEKREGSMEEESAEAPTISSKTDEDSNSEEEVETTNETETISNDTELEGEDEEDEDKPSPIIEDFVEEHQAVSEKALLNEENEILEDESGEVQAPDEEELSSEMSVSENCFVLDVAKELLQFTITEENGEKTISITPLTAVKIVINEKQMASEDGEEDQEVSSSDPSFESAPEIEKEDKTKDIPISDELNIVEEGEINKEPEEEISSEVTGEIKEVVMEESKTVEAREDESSMEVTEEDIAEDFKDIVGETDEEFIEGNEEVLEEIVEEEEVIEEEEEEEGDDVAMKEGESALVIEPFKNNEDTELKIEEAEIVCEDLMNEETVELTGIEENLRHASTTHETKENRNSVVVSDEEEKEQIEAIVEANEEIRVDGGLSEINEEKCEEIKYRIQEVACVQVIPFVCEACNDLKEDEKGYATTADIQQDSIDEYIVISQLFEETMIAITNRELDPSAKAAMSETIEDFDGSGKCEVLIPNVQIGEVIIKTLVVLEDDEMPKLVPYEVDGNTSNIEYDMPDSLGNPEVILDHPVNETVEVSSLEVSSTTNETSDRRSKSPEAKFRRIKSPSVITSRHYRKKAKAQKEVKERLKKQVNHVQLKCTVKLEEIKILKQTPKSALKLGRKETRKKKKVSFRLDENDEKSIGEGEIKKRLPSPDLTSMKDVVRKVEGRNVAEKKEKAEDNSKDLKEEPKAISAKEALPVKSNDESPAKAKENPSYSSSNIARSLWKNAVKNEKLFNIGKSPTEETNTSNKRRLSLEEYIKRKKYIRDLAQKTPRSNSQTNDDTPSLKPETLIPAEIVLPKKTFDLDKSAIEEKLNSLELFLPKVNKLPQQKTTAQEEVSKKLEELLAQKPISFESRTSESVLIRRFLNRECLKPEEVKKIRQIVHYKRALEEMKSRRPDCRRRNSYDFSKNVNIDFRDFEIKSPQDPNLNAPIKLNIEETNRELHESILSLSEIRSRSNTEASKPKIIEETVGNEEVRDDLAKPSNSQLEAGESQPKSLEPSKDLAKPNTTLDKDIPSNSQPTDLAKLIKPSGNEIRSNSQSQGGEFQPKSVEPSKDLAAKSNKPSDNEIRSNSQSKSDKFQPKLVEPSKDLAVKPNKPPGHEIRNNSQSKGGEFQFISVETSKDLAAKPNKPSDYEIRSNSQSTDLAKPSKPSGNAIRRNSQSKSGEFQPKSVELSKNLAAKFNKPSDNDIRSNSQSTDLAKPNKPSSNAIRRNSQTKSGECQPKSVELSKDLAVKPNKPSDNDIRSNSQSTDLKKPNKSSGNAIRRNSQLKSGEFQPKSLEFSKDLTAKPSKPSGNEIQNLSQPTDLTKPNKPSGNEIRSNSQSKGGEFQPKSVELSKDLATKPSKPSDIEIQTNSQSKTNEFQPKSIEPNDKPSLETVQPKPAVLIIKESPKLNVPSKPKPSDLVKPSPKDLPKFTGDKSQMISYTSKSGNSETQKLSKPEEKIQAKPGKEVLARSDSKNDLQVDKTAPHPSNTKRNCLISPQDLKTRLNVLLSLYKKQVQVSNENTTTIDMENLRKIEEIIQKLASSNKNVYEIRRPEQVPNKDIKIHLKKVPGDGQQKRRKRFRNLYSGEDSDDEPPTAKEAKLSVEATDGSAIDYSVYQRNTQAGVPKLVIKRRKSEFKVDLQPFVKLIRMPTLDSLAKKRRKTIKLLVR